MSRTLGIGDPVRWWPHGRSALRRAPGASEPRRSRLALAPTAGLMKQGRAGLPPEALTGQPGYEKVMFTLRVSRRGYRCVH